MPPQQQGQPQPQAQGLPTPDPQMDKAFQEQLSMNRPDDVAMMGMSGAFQADMTVRQLFEQLGVDVDGPLSQLEAVMQQQQEKADPLNKAKALGGAGSPQGQPPPPQQPSQDPMGELMR